MTETRDVSADVVERLARVLNDSCWTPDPVVTELSWRDHAEYWKEQAAAIVAHLRAHPEDAAAVLGPQPTVYAHDDGTTTVDWPEGVTSCVMSREALDGYAENVSGAWRALNEAQRDLDSMRRMLDRRRTEATP